MKKYFKYIAYFIVALLVLQYLLMSIVYAGFAMILLQDVSPFMHMLGAINGILVSFQPLLIYIFLLLSTKYMLDILDVNNVSYSRLSVIIGNAFISPLMGMLFYNISILFFRKETTITTFDNIRDMHFLFNMQIDDFKVINIFCWFVMYYMLITILYIRENIPLIKSLIASLLPTIFVIMASYIITK